MVDQVQSDRMHRARSRLLQRASWFGGGSLKLDMHENNSVPTAATNGKTLPYNAEFVSTLSDGAAITLVAHETGHCMFGHIWRFAGHNNPTLVNMACDYWLNEILEKDGFEPIPNWLRDRRFDGFSVQEILGILGREEREKPDGQKPTDNPNKPDDMLPPDDTNEGDSESESEDGDGDKPGDKPGKAPADDGTEASWAIFAEEAKMIADKRGQMGAGAARGVEETRKPRADPWAVLARFMSRHSDPTDYTWTRPNRKMLAATGYYMPGMDNQNTAPIILAIDTSGSVTQDMLNEFAAHATHIMQELRPQALHVIYCDAQINGTVSFTPDDGPVRLTMMGGGGTAFQPVFDYIAEHPGEYADASCLVYLTDADGDNATLTNTPNIPTMWGIVPGWGRALPFGETVKLY